MGKSLRSLLELMVVCITRYLCIFVLCFSWVCEIYAFVRRSGCIPLVRGVTNHGDQCPSPTGVNWVSDGVGIDSGAIYAYRRCSLLMQRKVIDSSYLLRKKQSDSVWTGRLQLSNCQRHMGANDIQC